MKYECNCYRPEPHKCTHETEGRAPERCCISGEADADWKEVTECSRCAGLISRPYGTSYSAEHEDFPAAETPVSSGAKAGDWLRHALGGIVRVGKTIPGGFLDVEGRIFKYIYPHSFTPVTFRKWTPEEWRKQVGKAFYMKTDAYLLTSYNASWKNTLVFSELGRMSEDLATATFTQFNGMPCGAPQVDGKDVVV